MTFPLWAAVNEEDGRERVLLRRVRNKERVSSGSRRASVRRFYTESRYPQCRFGRI